MNDAVVEKLKWPLPSGYVIVGSIGVNLLALALPIVMLQVFDRVIPNEARATLTALVAGLFVALVLDFALKTARVSLLTRLGDRFEREALSVASGRLLNADLMKADPASGVHDYDRLNALGQLRDHVGGEGRLHLIDLPFAGVFIAMIWLIGGPLVIAPLICFGVLLVFSLFVSNRQKRIFSDCQTIDARRYAFLTEFLEKIGTIKSNRMETGMLRRFEMLQRSSHNVSRRLMWMSGSAQAFSAVFSQAAVAVVGLFGAYLVVEGRIGVAELAACTLLNGRAVQPMLRMLSLRVQAESVGAARKKADEVLKTSVRSAPEVHVPRSLVGDRGHSVEFRNVSLRGKPDAPPLFEGLTRSIQAGSVVQITGSQGAGKGTLARALFGEHPIEHGEILVDGRHPGDQTRARGPGTFAFAGPEPLMFSCTLIENVALSNRHAKIEAAYAAIRVLGLDEEIKRLPFGYETQMGEGGFGGGSKGFMQRIALARVVALAPRILVINDALSAMDPQSAAISRDVMRRMKGECTQLLVGRETAVADLIDDVVDLDAYRTDAPLNVVGPSVRPAASLRVPA